MDMNVKRRQREILVIFLLSYSVVCQGPTITCPNTGGGAATTRQVKGTWTDWAECDVKCGEGETKRERECVYSVEKVGNKCDDTAIDITTNECNQTAPVTFTGSYGKWTPWKKCDFETCGDKGLYDGRRAQLSCVETSNQCKYVMHVEEKKFCQRPHESASVFKLSTNLNASHPGWREATVVDVLDNYLQVRQVMKDYIKSDGKKPVVMNEQDVKEKGKSEMTIMMKKWTVARLQDGSVKGFGYRVMHGIENMDDKGIEIDRNYTYGYEEVLLIETGVKYVTGTNSWSTWTACDATCTLGQEKKEIRLAPRLNLGFKRRTKTCVHKGVWNGTGCEFKTEKPTPMNCAGMEKMIFPGLFGKWSEFSSCDKTMCGRSPKSHKIRSQTTCASHNANTTAKDQCITLYRFEEAAECEWKPAADRDRLTTRGKIILSLSSWSVLFVIIIISFITLRKAEQTSKNAIKLFKESNANAANTVEVQMEPPKGGGLKGGAKTENSKRKKKKEEEEEANIKEEAMEMESKAEEPLLQTQPVQC